jgi:tetratricopeptide (TPR) repeat protein
MVWIPRFGRGQRKIHEPIDYARNFGGFLGTVDAQFNVAVRGARARDFFDPKKLGSAEALRQVTAALVRGVVRSPIASYLGELQRLDSAASVLCRTWADYERLGGRSRRKQYEREFAALREDLDVVWDEMARAVERAASVASDRVKIPIEERPDDLAKRDAHVERSEAHVAAGRLEDACYELERAAALDARLKGRLDEIRTRHDVENFRSWGERHALAGKTHEAIECYERLLRKAPGDEAATRRLEELRRAGG